MKADEMVEQSIETSDLVQFQYERAARNFRSFYAVRSSCNLEDHKEFSFAGLFTANLQGVLNEAVFIPLLNL